MLFENLAHTDDTEQRNHRIATAVANKRVKDRFGAFLANADGDLPARLALVEDELHEIVQDVVAEHGGDVIKIEAAIKHSLDPTSLGGGMGLGATNPGVNPSMGQGAGAPGAAAANAAGGQTCLHGNPAATCPMCMADGAAGGGAVGAYGMTHSIGQQPSTGPILGSTTSAGGFCDTCRKWKSGPNAGCTCDSDTSEDAPEKSDTDEPSAEEKESSVHAQQLSIDSQPIMHAEPLPDEPRKEGVTDIDGELANAPSAVGTGTISRTAEALETVDLPKGDESALGGPSPKIDKGNSGDNFGWSLDPIDTQMDGSPHPTKKQDPTDKADYNKKDFLDQTRAVTETETLPTGTGMDDAGFNDTRNIEQYPTKTFGDGIGTDADPVTNQALSSWQVGSAVDPDKNPIRELIEEYSGHMMPNQVESAIQDWQVGKAS